MGMYTEFHFRAHLKEDGSADDVMSWLANCAVSDWDAVEAFSAHPFFGSDMRWQALLRGSCAVYQFAHPLIVRPKDGPRYRGGPEWDTNCYNEVLIHSSFKNYGNEIDLFLDWIRPYIDARYGPEFIGYSLYEEDVEPKLYYSGALGED